MRGATCPDCNRLLPECICQDVPLNVPHHGYDEMNMPDSLSNRGLEFNEFADIVVDHIEKYTVPQYGDSPNDMAEHFTKNDFDTQLNKYILRQRNGGGARGMKEDMRDYLKIAHYAGMCYMMMKRELEKEKE